MNDLIRELAIDERQFEKGKEVVKYHQEKLEQTPEWKTLQNVKAGLEQWAQTVEDLRAKIKDQTVKAFLDTGEKHIHPALGIREGISFSYDSQLAKAWCEHRLPDALIVDKKLFEKALKAFEQVPNFVKVDKTVTATIATDLSSYLPDGSVQ